MLNQHQHTPEGAKMIDPRFRGPRRYTLPASALFVTTVMLMLAFHAIGQTNEPVWPAPVSLQLALMHLL